MSGVEFVDLCSSDEESENENVGFVTPFAIANSAKRLILIKPEAGKLTRHIHMQVYEGNKSSSALSTTCDHNYEQGAPPMHVHVGNSGATLSLPPMHMNFLSAAYNDNNDIVASELSIKNTHNYLHVHPMFLHSNATSHSWIFGAIAELIDNAVDEVQNGATFVFVDKILNPKDGSPALLIQDDGGGMDPEAMRQCMSFGFSEKSKTAIGQYGNGFKTGSIRLGADVIVFSRHLNNMILTQSIGLLSYTYLMRTQHDRVVVPMVNYKFDTSTGYLERQKDEEHFRSNLSILLQWSPYPSEEELLKQFKDIGSHGTKIIIFNLWFNDDRNLELDFDSDSEDIRISGHVKKIHTLPAWKLVNEEYIGNCFDYSLRAYLSILYLWIPDNFRIILRGQEVKLHNIADDLKYPEYIMYRPQGCDSEEMESVTTIGFVKEAPKVNIHGFNVYHKNRLILPFWQVVNYNPNSKSRGVVGVLRADFLEPTHNKQDFERTSLFQKLELRLKSMTSEYWDYHCHLIGYPERGGGAEGSQLISSHIVEKPGPLLNKRKKTHQSIDLHNMKRQAMQENATVARRDQNVPTAASPTDQRILTLLEAHRKLLIECLEHEKEEEELDIKVTQLRSKIQEVQHEYDTLLAEFM